MNALFVLSALLVCNKPVIFDEDSALGSITKGGGLEGHVGSSFLSKKTGSRLPHRERLNKLSTDTARNIIHENFHSRDVPPETVTNQFVNFANVVSTEGL